MGEKVHFWSDKPDDWHASSRGDAEKHADAEHGTATQIDSIAKLKSVFRAMLAFNATLDQVDFHTHGGPGGIALGADSLNYSNVGIQLGNQGFEALFNKDAAIRVFLTKTAKSQFVSINSYLSPAPRRPYRGLPPID